MRALAVRAELVAEFITLYGLRRSETCMRSPSIQLLTARTTLLHTRPRFTLELAYIRTLALGQVPVVASSKLGCQLCNKNASQEWPGLKCAELRIHVYGVAECFHLQPAGPQLDHSQLEL